MSGTANGAGASKFVFGRNAAVSVCSFLKVPTDAELQGVKYEEGRENYGALIWNLGNYHRRKMEDKTVKSE